MCFTSEVCRAITLAHWSVWSAWSSCNSTCGIIQRTRICLSTLILDCIGNSTDLMICNSQGISNVWSAWTTCSTLCGYGIMNRTREYCVFPVGIIGKALDSVPCFSNSSCKDLLLVLKETALQSNNLLSTLNNFFDEYEISFDVYFNKVDNLGNILQILDVFGESCSDISFFYGSLNIFSGIERVSFEVSLNEWSSIQILQEYNNGNYSNTVVINGTAVFSGIIQPKLFSNISVFACLGVCMPGVIMKNFSLVSYTHVVWSQWSEWSSCNLSLLSTRTRTCSGNYWIDCIGLSTEIIACNISFNALWTPWTIWSTCNVSYGYGFSNRTRKCDTSNGTEMCSGNMTEVVPCFLNISNFALWTPWTIWSTCNVSFGYGFSNRTRKCDTLNGTEMCFGNITEVIPCFLNISNIEGWAVWSDCSVSCGLGYKKSYPFNYTRNAIVESCININCPVDGMWGDWKEFECSSVGIKIYKRSCDNPLPLYFGLDCMGVSNYTQESGLNEISPVNGGWSQWSSWSWCTQPCKSGVRNRFRECTNPTPKYGGFYCIGSIKDIVSCLEFNCNKVAVSLMFLLSDENFIEPYSDPTTDPALALQESIYAAIETFYNNHNLNVSFFIELHSLQEQL